LRIFVPSLINRRCHNLIKRLKTHVYKEVLQMQLNHSVSLEKSKARRLYFGRTWQLYLMLVLPVAYFFIFKYIPIFNARLAFLDYNMFSGISGSKWNNFANFKEVFHTAQFYTVLRNTLMLNLLDLLLGFPTPIIIALILNELSSNRIRNVTQTIIYIPYFLSWVIISGIVLQVFSSSGIVNTVITSLTHGTSVNFLGNVGHWIAVYIGSGIWQGAGYGTIIYLAALSTIDTTLYEAAYVDGAGRFRRIWNITLPSIKSTIVMLLILSSGSIINISFDRPYMMGNSLVQSVCDVISTYVYRTGLQGGRFDYSTAVGLFQSVVSFTLLMIVNKVCKKLGEEGIM
jgi:putative aldouronate transport system permease protein